VLEKKLKLKTTQIPNSSLQRSFSFIKKELMMNEFKYRIDYTCPKNYHDMLWLSQEIPIVFSYNIGDEIKHGMVWSGEKPEKLITSFDDYKNRHRRMLFLPQKRSWELYYLFSQSLHPSEIEHAMRTSWASQESILNKIILYPEETATSKARHIWDKLQNKKLHLETFTWLDGSSHQLFNKLKEEGREISFFHKGNGEWVKWANSKVSFQEIMNSIGAGPQTHPIFIKNNNYISELKEFVAKNAKRWIDSFVKLPWSYSWLGWYRITKYEKVIFKKQIYSLDRLQEKIENYKKSRPDFTHIACETCLPMQSEHNVLEPSCQVTTTRDSTNEEYVIRPHSPGLQGIVDQQHEWNVHKFAEEDKVLTDAIKDAAIRSVAAMNKKLLEAWYEPLRGNQSVDLRFMDIETLGWIDWAKHTYGYKKPIVIDIQWRNYAVRNKGILDPAEINGRNTGWGIGADNAKAAISLWADPSWHYENTNLNVPVQKVELWSAEAVEFIREFKTNFYRSLHGSSIKPSMPLVPDFAKSSQGNLLWTRVSILQPAFDWKVKLFVDIVAETKKQRDLMIWKVQESLVTSWESTKQWNRVNWKTSLIVS